MRKLWLELSAVIVGSLAVGLLAFLLPVSFDRQAQIALYTFVSMLHVGVAVMYLLGLKGFTLQFRVGYLFMSAAMVMYAIGLLELPLLALSELGNAQSNQLLSGDWFFLQASPFFLFLGLFYLGVRKLAKVIAIRTVLLSSKVVLAVVAGVGLIAAFIPLPKLDNPVNGIPLNLLIAVIGAGLTLVIIAVALLFRLKKDVSALYKPAFAWNFYGFLAFFILQLLDPSTFLPASNWYVKYGTAVPFLITVACFIKAAFEYNRIPYLESQLQAPAAKDGERQTSVDIVVAVALLISNPKAVDNELDELRGITAQMSADRLPTEEQQIRLADLYKVLETYLTQSEPARKYTVQDLRQLVEIRYKGSVNEPAFWSRFNAPVQQQTVQATPAGS